MSSLCRFCFWVSLTTLVSHFTWAQTGHDLHQTREGSPPLSKNSQTHTFFNQQVRPILEKHCLQCHGPNQAEGELRLDSESMALKGGTSGPAILPGNTSGSLFIERTHLASDEEEVMPPDGPPLSIEQKNTLTKWVKAGASWPMGQPLKAQTREQLAIRANAQNKKLVKIQAFPPSITLQNPQDFNSFIIQANYADGVSRDITFESSLVVQNPGIAILDGATVYPKGNGKTELQASYQNQNVIIPITISQFQEDRSVSFKLDVMPIFMKAGCNTGSCHGSARGQDRFMLSLFGYDPEGDHHRITREQGTRRINLALPEESMLLEKAIGAVPHTGGKLFDQKSNHWKILHKWLQAGAPKDTESVAKPERIELFPPTLLLEGKGATQQIIVLAHYSDGSTRDVTPLTVFQSNKEETALVNEHGEITAGKHGEAFVMARFHVFTEGIQTIVIPEGLDYTKPKVKEYNFVDTLVHNKLDKLRITPSPVCSDEVFIRRAYLDITGMLPTADELQEFLKDQKIDKRSRLVDQLVERKEFTEIWVMKFAELLQIQTDPNQGMSYKATLLYFNWLKERIAQNIPMNQIVKELLTSQGGTFVNPPTNYYQVERDNLKITENVAQVFMGMRIQCAQCHNHPFDQWTQNDYYSFASFFSQVGRKRGTDPREQVIYDRKKGEINHPIHNKPLPPKFLGGPSPDIPKDIDRRKVLADWLASPDNPFFAKNLANLVWSHFFGQGIIEPVDDVRISNPPANPELLNELANRFTAYQYDFKKLVKDVCKSRTYQLSTQATNSNQEDRRNFARASMRRLRAEILLDIISQVTETKNKFPGLPLGAKAVQIANGKVNNYFLTTFGRAKRETVCSCEVVMEPSLSQALHLLNGDTTNKRISQGKVIKNALKAGQSTEDIITLLYRRCYSRNPTTEELQNLSKTISNGNKEKGLTDIFWALLNSKEFVFNH
jgi:mono/diheme cytochrome c family protein